MKPSRLAGGALVVALALAGSAAIVRADPAPAPQTAKDRLRAGHAAYAVGDYASAIEHYQAGYEMSRLPEFVFNLAQAYRLQGDRQNALSAYREFLQLAPDHAVAPEVREHIAALESALAREREGGGEREEDAGRRTAAPPTSPRVEVDTAAESPPRPGRALRWTGAGVAAAGVAALGVGVWYTLEARRIEGELDGDEWPAGGDDLYEQGQRAETRQIVWTIGGAVGVAAGAGLYLLGRRDAARAGSVGVTLSPAPGGGWVRVGGHF